MEYEKRIDDFEKFRERYSTNYSNCKALHAEISKLRLANDKVASLIKLGISIGVQHAGVIQSSVRSCLQSGASKEEILMVVDLTTGTLSFPAQSDALNFVLEALEN